MTTRERENIESVVGKILAVWKDLWSIAIIIIIIICPIAIAKLAQT